MDLVEKPRFVVPVRLRVVTYNVFQARYLQEPKAPDAPRPALDPLEPPASVAHRGGRGAEGRSVLRDFATLPALHSADVILLQEALAGVRRQSAPVDTVAVY